MKLQQSLFLLTIKTLLVKYFGNNEIIFKNSRKLLYIHNIF